MSKGELIYKSKGDQLSFYKLPDGQTIHGGHIKDGTLLALRNRACHLHTDRPNVFEILEHDDDDIYLCMHAHQVEYVSGNIGTNADDQAQS